MHCRLTCSFETVSTLLSLLPNLILYFANDNYTYVACLPHHKYMPLISITLLEKYKYLSLLYSFIVRYETPEVGYEKPGVRYTWLRTG